jgi:3-polyprenyl-4-hydroxybenzoate decarboxylase
LEPLGDPHAGRPGRRHHQERQGNTLDPSQTDDIMTAKMIIDATRSVRRPFATRLDVPAEVRARFPIEKYFK